MKFWIKNLVFVLPSRSSDTPHTSIPTSRFSPQISHLRCFSVFFLLISFRRIRFTVIRGSTEPADGRSVHECTLKMLYSTESRGLIPSSLLINSSVYNEWEAGRLTDRFTANSDGAYAPLSTRRSGVVKAVRQSFGMLQSFMAAGPPSSSSALYDRRHRQLTPQAGRRRRLSPRWAGTPASRQDGRLLALLQPPM